MSSFAWKLEVSNDQNKENNDDDQGLLQVGHVV